MAFSVEQKGISVLQFAKCELVVTVQQKFCMNYQKKVSRDKTTNSVVQQIQD